MARKLKVFSADMGFVRAVVAAPSRKAALEAWGVRDDLFARGAAREIDDADLVKQAAARPGDVLKIPVASDAAILSAAEKRGTSRAKDGTGKKPAKRLPAPSRDKLEAARKALKRAQGERQAALDEIQTKQAALDAERDKAEAKHGKALKGLEKARDREKQAYEAALKAWKG